MQPAHSLKLNDQRSTVKAAVMIMVFVLIVIAGLTYVKWWPYYHKALTAATAHSIGSSILSGANDGTWSWSSAWSYAEKYFKAIWKAAVLGILLGSLVQVLLPAGWLHKVLGKASMRSTLLGGAASIPGMMCSCCAAPIAASLRKKNVSVGASLAFWIGNPVLNPATLIFMTFVLSWKFTLIRVLFGVLLTFGVSYWANRFADRNADAVTETKVLEPEMMPEQQQKPFLLRWLRALGSLALQVIPAYIITVLLLGGLQGLIFPTSMSTGFIAIILFAAAGMLFVIPTAAEIPIIQSFLALGVGAGPAAALLLTLPAVSLPSLFMVAKSFPKKVLLFVALSVIGVGILSGIVGSLLL
ncbi:membrane protein [Cohnella kolymensis]|uniref:Membrane protein n=1 Tax=Cohnella kolymensis TaxID=1590652 RepID=A0ABR5A170_9BACL|nr:permease [Cohnella kolymensis]KIL34167.1 membrane protein [Cohnella kolymensis]